LSVTAYSMLDASVAWEVGAGSVRVDVNNLLNAGAYAAGYTDGSMRYLFPIATRNLLVTVRRSFGGFAGR
ncbi:MAG: hypothetical protein U9Q74_01515, partial [Gemmatimonadota bacterium]|nr:hypothetical protein [Gemmatimonadota bacterium]